MTCLLIWLVANALLLVWRVWVTSAEMKTRNRMDDGAWIASGRREVDPSQRTASVHSNRAWSRVDEAYAGRSGRRDRC